MAAQEAPIPYQFTLRDLWSRKVFLALLRRHALNPYRYRGQRYTTVMVKVPKRFVDETLWPEFERLNQSLHAYLNEVTDRVVAEVLHADSSDAAEVAEAPQLTAGGPATVGDSADAGNVVPARASAAEDSAWTAEVEPTSGSAGRKRGGGNARMEGGASAAEAPGPECNREGDGVDYHEFKRAFLDALRDSRLPTIGTAPSEESLDLRNTDRTVVTYVEPLDREIGRPFHVSGAISWRWDALQSARTRTREEDLLTELLGREDAYDIDTERPWLRVDLVLRAGLEYGKWLSMPSPAVWARWMEEMTGRLENVEPLVPEDVARELPDGQLAILAWQGGPEIRASCSPEGELRLESIKLSAFQMIELPRQWDSPEREPDDDPHAQLVAMFRRLKAALHAWGEVMDHLAET